MMDILTTVISIILTSVCSYAVWLLQSMKKSKSNTTEALKILMRAQLKQYHHEFVSRGTITSSELDECIELYEVYHNLGGNGTGTRMIEDIKKLNIVG